MLTRTSIRDYQLNLFEQIKNADMVISTDTMLGLAIGESRYLIHTNEVNEVLQVPKLAPVPLTQSWFLGMANIRGALYGITDMSQYWGEEPIPIGLKARILLVVPHYKINSGLLVSSILGIRNLTDFELITDPDTTTVRLGIIGRYKDKQGRLWHVLNLQALVANEQFLEIAV